MVGRLSSSKLKTGSKSKSLASPSPPRLSLFGEPQLLEGEDAAAYHSLLARLYATVKPVDVIDEIFIVDMVVMEWEVLRWRRLKLGFIRTITLEALKSFLVNNIDYDLYRDSVQDKFATVLQELGAGEEIEQAKKLLDRYARGEASELTEISDVAAQNIQILEKILDKGRADKAEELVQRWIQGEPNAVRLIPDLLAGATTSMDSLVAEKVVQRARGDRAYRSPDGYR